GDAKLYDALMAAADRVTSPDEHYRYLYAVADFQDPALIDRALQYSRSPQLRSQDTAIYLGRFFDNEAARSRAWSFLKQHWAELDWKIAISWGGVNLVSSLASFCDAGTRDDIRTLFTEHKLPTAARTLDQAADRVRHWIDRR